MYIELHEASLVAQMVNKLPEMRETWVRSLGWEDPLEEDMATCSSILAWRIPWTEEPGRLQSIGLQRVDMTKQFSLSLFIWLHSPNPYSPLTTHCGQVKSDSTSL